MARSPGVLTVLADPVRRYEIERIGAAIGVRVGHAEAVPDRREWSAAAAVILDEAAVVGCAHVTSAPFPRRAHVLVVAGAEVPNTTWSAAISLGAQQVLTAPLDEAVLAGALAEAAETVGDNRRDGRVAAVIGGCG